MALPRPAGVVDGIMCRMGVRGIIRAGAVKSFLIRLRGRIFRFLIVDRSLPDDGTISLLAPVEDQGQKRKQEHASRE